tara:strand:+ start:200 stop:715 length:516 start_codon:yes stop_codon:yes gene_type:complete
MNTYENEQLLTTTVHIPIQKITKTKNIDGLITYHLKNLFEGVCGKEGYVVKNSIFVVQRSIGKIVTIDSKSKIQYDVIYKLKTIYPSKQDEYECIIDSISKMGIISYLDYNTEEEKTNIKNSPLLIIIPLEYIKGDKKITDYYINDKIVVSVLDSRIKYKSKQIQVVAEIV